MTISTGSKDLDEFLRYEKGKSYLIYGEASTGKTTLAILAAIEEAKKNKVFFLDVENSFSIERVKQILGEKAEKILSNIFVLKARDFDEQEDKLKQVFKIIKNIETDILIIDTIGIHFRKEVKEKDYRLVNARLKNMIEELGAVKRMGKVVLLTNQVYQNFEGKIIPVADSLIKPDYKIKLSKGKFRKLEFGDKVFKFEIDDKGIRKN